jgi:arylsulfatase A-like enzyme
MTISRRLFMQSAAAAAAAQTAPAGRPNIVLIMADDMGFSDIGCYGGEIATPNLNALAKGGIRFTQFYNAARCCPTRAALMTGLYPHQAGIGHMMEDRQLPAYRGDLNKQCVTIAQVLKSAGYRTYMSGKWHVTPVNDSKHNWPLQRGFDKFYGTIHGAGSFYDPVTLTRDNTPIAPDKPDYFYTDAISDNAVAYIAEAANQPEPFFLYIAYTAPHWPLHAPESDIAKYRGRYKQGWDALRAERHKRMISMGIVDKNWALTPRDPSVPAWSNEPYKDWMQQRMEVYAAQVDNMDQGIGRVLAKLKETGIEDNTLVLFLADNGGCAEELRPIRDESRRARHVPKTTRDGKPVKDGNIPNLRPGPYDTYQSYGVGWANASNTPFRLYKHWVHEGGISSPLIARWPRVIKKTGGLNSEIAHLIDIMATCVDVGAAQYPKTFQGNPITPMEGKSLKPIFETGKRTPHAELFWEHEGNRAVRQGKWKLVSRWPGKWELYDIAADRTELNDLAKTNPQKVAELSAKWDAWAKRCNVVPWDQVPKG